MKTSSQMSLFALVFIVIELFQPGPLTSIPLILACTGLIIREIERK